MDGRRSLPLLVRMERWTVRDLERSHYFFGDEGVLLLLFRLSPNHSRQGFSPIGETEER